MSEAETARRVEEETIQGVADSLVKASAMLAELGARPSVVRWIDRMSANVRANYPRRYAE